MVSAFTFWNINVLYMVRAPSILCSSCAGYKIFTEGKQLLSLAYQDIFCSGSTARMHMHFPVVDIFEKWDNKMLSWYDPPQLCIDIFSIFGNYPANRILCGSMHEILNKVKKDLNLENTARLIHGIFFLFTTLVCYIKGPWNIM